MLPHLSYCFNLATCLNLWNGFLAFQPSTTNSQKATFHTRQFKVFDCWSLENYWKNLNLLYLFKSIEVFSEYFINGLIASIIMSLKLITRLDSRCSVWCIGVKSAWVGQSLILQVAKKASVLKRRKSRNRMEVSANAPMDPSSTAMVASSRCDSDNEVVCYSEEPKAG